MHDHHIKNRLYVVVLIATALILAAVILFGRGTMIRSFQRVETDAAKQGVAQAYKAVEIDLEELAALNRRFAQQDLAYSFLENARERSYLESNFQAQTLSERRIDLAWIVDSNGSDVFSVFGDRATRGAVTPVPAELLNQLKRQLGPLGHASNLPAMQRVVHLGGRLAAFSVQPVLRTDRTGPSLGFMVFARLLDARAVARWSAMSRLPVTFAPADSEGGLPATVPPAIKDWFALGPDQSESFSVPEDGEFVAGYQTLHDIYGKPAGVLSTRIPRSVLQLGLHTANVLTIVIFALVLGFAATALLLLSLLDRSWKARDGSERRYRSVIEQLDDCVALADATTGGMIEINAAMTRLLGFSDDEVRDLHVELLFVGLPGHWRTGEPDPPRRTHAHECRMRAKDGHLIDVEVTFSRLVAGGIALACLVARDVTARKRAEKELLDNQRKLAHLAHHDPLTGLPNRLHLQMRLPRLLLEAESERQGLALLYLDVDQFKHINDSRGHGSGDQLLALLGQRLRNCVAAHDLVVRMGGDEFVVVATRVAGAPAADALARRVNEALRAPFVCDGTTYSITLSIGISVYPDDGRDGEVLLKHADIALYQAKDLGRNNHQFFRPAMTARLSERVALEQALRHALGTEQLFLVFQPLVEVHDGRLSGFEALLRWRHPEHGLISPARFIPVAEQCGVIVELGEYVIRQVCRQLREWHSEMLPLVPVSINISPMQFERGRLAETVSRIASEFDIDPTLLNFEITESAVMHNTEAHIGTLESLRSAGCRISIDDFGTGYSSLSYLKHLPIDALKIDKAFVRDMAADPNDAAIVSAIIGMARTLGLKTVAEGVENQDQLKRLRDLGCDTAQGYYFSVPVTAEDCGALLQRQRVAEELSASQRIRIIKSAATG
ncbi:MAG: EAL domain-containing protein [Steroidobacteraceae bacterium]